MLLWVALCFLSLFLLPFIRAQETWNAVSSPTTQTLWSVCHGGGQFVAVGENGTILTSPDGVAWTPRVSGFPTRWLVGVGYGNGLYVAVGEAGLILTSSDAMTWTARHTFGTRINAVAYGNGFFLAVDDVGVRWRSLDGITWVVTNTFNIGPYLRGLAYGAPHFVTSGLNNLQTSIDGVSFTHRIGPLPTALEGVAYGRNTFVAAGGPGAVYTSRDASTWTLQSSAPRTGVRGLGFFNNQFVAVGNDGEISTSFDGSAWTPRASSTTQTLLAVAGSDDALIAVGGGGTILRSLPAQNAPAIVTPPSSMTAAVTSNVTLAVAASGSTPLAYQWLRNGQPIAGATGETLFLTDLEFHEAGNFSVRVTNAFGAITSPEAALAVAFLPLPDPVDPAFTVSPSLNKAPRVAVEQPDGKIIIGGDFLVLNGGQAQFGLARLNPDGSLDTTFKPGALDPTGYVQALAVQTDGKILVGGNFATINGVAAKNLARLNADGSFDHSFSSGVDPTSASPTRGILVTAGGKILVRHAEPRLTRLNSDGSFDPLFIRAANSSEGIFLGLQAAALQADGKIVVAGATIAPGSNAVSGLRRLNADGSIDATFASLSLGKYNNVRALRVLPDGRVMVVLSYNLIPLAWRDVVLRFTPTGASDPTFSPLIYSDDLVSAAIAPDGRTWLSAKYITAGNVDLAYRYSLVRVNANGANDFTYSMGPGILDAAGVSTFADFLLPLENGRLLVGGNFSKIQNTPRNYLAQLVEKPAGGAALPEIRMLSPRYLTVREGEPLTVQFELSGLFTQVGYTTATGGETLLAKNSSEISFRITATTVFYFHAYDQRGYRSALIPIYARVVPSAPVISTQPIAVQTLAGRSATLSVQNFGTGPFTYQWFKNESPITLTTFSPTSPSLTIPSTMASDSGDYTVVIRNNLGFATSQTVHLGVNENSRLGAISTRAWVGPGERTTIAGFVIHGTASKTILARGVGPALTARFGLFGTINDPKLTLYDAKGTVVASNDNWETNGVTSAQMDAAGLFKLDAGSKDAALSVTLAPGNYTAHLTGLAGENGIGLIEIYENDNRSERLTAISTRAYVGTGDGLTIPGISINGPVPKKVIVRAVGPTMASLGVNAPLADPILTLVNSITGEVIATNDDWSSSANKAEIVAASAAAGNFPLPDPSKDAVVVVTVPPGAYTALVRGANGGTGVALVEVYEVP